MRLFGDDTSGDNIQVRANEGVVLFGLGVVEFNRAVSKGDFSDVLGKDVVVDIHEKKSLSGWTIIVSEIREKV